MISKFRLLTKQTLPFKAVYQSFLHYFKAFFGLTMFRQPLLLSVFINYELGIFPVCLI